MLSRRKKDEYSLAKPWMNTIVRVRWDHIPKYKVSSLSNKGERLYKLTGVVGSLLPPHSLQCFNYFQHWSGKFTSSHIGIEL